MRAATADGPPTRRRLAPAELDEPTCGAQQVKVRVVAAGLNRGELIQMGKHPKPATVPQPGGIEFAGELVEIGADAVTQLPLGARVMGRAPHSLAEFVVLDPRGVMPIPDSVPFTAAAGFPNAYVTAHDAVVTAAEVAAGDRVLVNAASSGVGVAALQIAKLRGAVTVIATSRSSDKLAALRRLHSAPDIGLVDGPDLAERVLELTDGHGVDAIIDTVGGSVLELNVRMLAIGGRLISVGRTASATGTLDLDRLALQRASIRGVTFRTRSPEEALRCSQRCAADLLEHLGRGELEVLVDSVFPLDEIDHAQERMIANEHVGKIVIEFRDEHASRNS